MLHLHPAPAPMRADAAQVFDDPVIGRAPAGVVPVLGCGRHPTVAARRA